MGIGGSLFDGLTLCHWMRHAERAYCTQKIVIIIGCSALLRRAVSAMSIIEIVRSMTQPTALRLFVTHATRTRRKWTNSIENRKIISDSFFCVCEKIPFSRSICRNVVLALASLSNTYHLQLPSNHIVLETFSTFGVFAPMLVGWSVLPESVDIFCAGTIRRRIRLIYLRTYND